MVANIRGVPLVRRVNIYGNDSKLTEANVIIMIKAETGVIIVIKMAQCWAQRWQPMDHEKSGVHIFDSIGLWFIKALKSSRSPSMD